ncbi:hypothetical protein [Actinacidiphila soli]|uniref:hypothetical protein n=1 Tax=Actinacidiphila soli TaxID=2487275 RepID=UPI000FCC1211|nr:hypothetical protein [Actinacidiphila soli]
MKSLFWPRPAASRRGQKGLLSARQDAPLKGDQQVRHRFGRLQLAALVQGGVFFRGVGGPAGGPGKLTAWFQEARQISWVQIF